MTVADALKIMAVGRPAPARPRPGGAFLMRHRGAEGLPRSVLICDQPSQRGAAAHTPHGHHHEKFLCAAAVCRFIALGPTGLTHVTETAPQLPPRVCTNIKRPIYAARTRKFDPGIGPDVEYFNDQDEVKYNYRPRGNSQ